MGWPNCCCICGIICSACCERASCTLICELSAACSCGSTVVVCCHLSTGWPLASTIGLPWSSTACWLLHVCEPQGLVWSARLAHVCCINAAALLCCCCC